MKTTQKELNLMGLAQRASQLVSGDESVESAIKQRKIHLVIVGSDISQRTYDKYVHLTSQASIPLLNHLSSHQISQALGKKRSIVGISNQGMSNTLLSYRMEKEEQYDKE